MMAVVLLPFPYAGDGYTIENLVTGDIRDFDAATDGLVEAGLISIEESQAKEPNDAIEIPVLPPKTQFQKRGR